MLEAIEEIRAHNIMVLNARETAQMVAHIQRIHALDQEIDTWLAQAIAHARRSMHGAVTACRACAKRWTPTAMCVTSCWRPRKVGGLSTRLNAVRPWFVRPTAW
jgi:hypothetical protein